MKPSFSLSYILIMLLLPLSANAAGIEVSPSKLDFTVSGASASQNILVANPTADVQIYQVYPDDFAEFIKTNPASFTLESGARKTVEVTVSASSPDNKLPEILATNLSVIGKPLADARFSVATGVKIPLTAKVSTAKQKPTGYKNILGFGALVIILLAGIYYSNKKQNKI